MKEYLTLMEALEADLADKRVEDDSTGIPSPMRSRARSCPCCS